jgi:hypothetical protein
MRVLKLCTTLESMEILLDFSTGLMAGLWKILEIGISLD